MADDRSASFEGSLTRLEAIVKALETEEPDLERAVALYAEGKDLVGRCETLLKAAQTAIDAVNAPAVAIEPARSNDEPADDAESPF